MSGVPSVSPSAFEHCPERLREQGFEVEIKVRDESLGIGTVEKPGRSLQVCLLRHLSGTAAVFIQGRCSRRQEFIDSIVDALEKDDDAGCKPLVG